MNRIVISILLLGLAACWFSGCAYKSTPVTASTNVVNAATLAANVLDERANRYDAALDYLPDNATFATPHNSDLNNAGISNSSRTHRM